jgi:hypothetical protein
MATTVNESFASGTYTLENTLIQEIRDCERNVH